MQRADPVRRAAVRRRFASACPRCSSATRSASTLRDGGGTADRAAHLDDRRDAARAVDAASDSRHPERPEPPRTRRARRHARSAGAGVQGPRQLVRSRQRAAGSAMPLASRLSVGGDRLRVGDGEPRGRGGAVLAGGRARSSATPRCARCCRISPRSWSRRPSRSSRGHPVRQLVERALAGRKSQGPVSITSAARATEADRTRRPSDLMLMSTRSRTRSGRFLGAMLVARNLGYLTHVHTTLNYSRKLAALGRLMAGVAHEVKNPLNAMTIHLELLKQKSWRRAASRHRARRPGRRRVADGRSDTKHVNIISDEIRRLDQVVIGFLKFARPDELKLQPVQLAVARQRRRVDDGARSRAARCRRSRLSAAERCPRSTRTRACCSRRCSTSPSTPVRRCRRRHAANRLPRRRSAPGRWSTSRTPGSGIPPEHLCRIFDLYFTTKKKGSGIGLSMVFRIVQLHDGEIEVQSTPGDGTRFRLMFPQA